MLQSIATVSAAYWSPAAAAASSWRELAFDSLCETAEQRVNFHQAAGFAVGFSAPGFRKMAYFGSRDLQTLEPVTSRTSFRIASVTKPFTAACILDLCERGVISLDDSLDHFFPDFPRAKEITVYQLLAHTSGLANWWGRLPDDVPHDFMSRPLPHRALMRMESPFLFEPGTMRSYSNSGYVLLGEIIEQVTENRFEDWLSSALLFRCGADGVELERNGQSAASWAAGYVWNNGHDEAIGTPMPFAAGGLRSNLHDVLAFSDALFHGKLLTAPSLQSMVAQARVNDGRLVQDVMYDSPQAPAEPWPEQVTEFGYGLGVNTWVQSGERFYSHSGLIDGFSAYLIHAPRTLSTVAILSNSQNGTSGFGQQIRDLLIAA